MTFSSVKEVFANQYLGEDGKAQTFCAGLGDVVGLYLK
jgi:hypothetical protein